MCWTVATTSKALSLTVEPQQVLLRNEPEVFTIVLDGQLVQKSSALTVVNAIIGSNGQAISTLRAPKTLVETLSPFGLLKLSLLKAD